MHTNTLFSKIKKLAEVDEGAHVRDEVRATSCLAQVPTGNNKATRLSLRQGVLTHESNVFHRSDLVAERDVAFGQSLLAWAGTLTSLLYRISSFRVPLIYSTVDPQTGSLQRMPSEEVSNK